MHYQSEFSILALIFCFMYTFFCIFAVGYGRKEICICLWNCEFLVYYLQLPLHGH